MPRLNTLLYKQALDTLEKTTDHMQIIEILQGFRPKSSKDLYMRVRKLLIEKKNQIFVLRTKGNSDNMQTERYKNIVDTLFTLASNRPKINGVYTEYAKDDVNELLTHYEEDLKDMTLVLDPEYLTRLSQTLYILKTREFEGVFQRIEEGLNNQKDKLDTYHVVNILRSFVHS